MEHIIRDSGQGLTENQQIQIQEYFNKSQPWIIIKELSSESEPDKVEVIINFAIEEQGYYRFIEMSESTQFKLYEELKLLGTLIMFGYPRNNGDPLRKMAFITTESEAEGIATKANTILNKYFL